MLARGGDYAEIYLEQSGSVSLNYLDKKVDTLGTTLSTEQRENFAAIKNDIAEAQKATTETLALIDKKIEEVSTKATQAGTEIAALTKKTEDLQEQVEKLKTVVESQKQALALLPTMAHDISDVRTNLQRAAGKHWLDSSKSTLREIDSDGLETERLIARLRQRPIAGEPTVDPSETPASASSSSAGGPADEASSDEEDDSTSEDEETVSTHATSSVASASGSHTLTSSKRSPDTTAARTVASSSASAEKSLSSGLNPLASSRGSDAFARTITGGRCTSAAALQTQAERPATHEKPAGTSGTWLSSIMPTFNK